LRFGASVPQFDRENRHRDKQTIEQAKVVLVKLFLIMVKQRVHLVWTEREGPEVEPPKRRSFGTRMMESLGQQLNGQVQLEY
jgi:two-component sensor histidine kinase